MEEKPAPEPIPFPSDAILPKYTSAGGVPLAPQVLVRGGTMSSRATQQIQQAEADANHRRAHQDQERAIAAAKHGPGSVAGLRSRQLVTPDSPMLALWYRKHDQYCISEITMVASPSGSGMEPMFTLVCTKCLERGVPQGQAQLQVMSSNRKFAINELKRGPKPIHEGGVPRIVNVCGEVTVEDKIRCGACGWTVRIVDSKVEEV